MNCNRVSLLVKCLHNTQFLSLRNMARFRTSRAPQISGIADIQSSLLPDLRTPPPADALELPKEPQRGIESTGEFPTYTLPSFNFAAYVNKSETLRKFVELGLDLSRIEKVKGFPQFLLKLEFDRDVKRHLLFLHDLGIPAENFGALITKNPLIFKESIADLETRVYYLRSKRFTPDNVREIVQRNPFWLMFSTKRIDRRLGWYQKNFNLTGDDIRFLTVRSPKLITYNLEHVRGSTFSIKEQMGFDDLETKLLLLSHPKFWMNNHEELIERFNFVHNVMKISHEKILQSPEILSSRRHRLEQRFRFLKFLGKVQFDETKPGYISFKALVEGTEQEFVLNVCKSSLETYDNFLKTL